MRHSPPSEATRSAAPAEAAPERVTPMMAQYVEIKAANPDCLLFYRMGDFYELFFRDAEIASRTLGIVLTKRGKHQGDDIPMCGVPVDRADDYLQRLIAAGHRVAVCEQTEDPAEARKRGNKSVVKRDVVRLVTPGTITEERLLEPGRASLFVAVARRKPGEAAALYGVAAIDISTGRFTVMETPQERLSIEFSRLEPREIVCPDAIHDDPELKEFWREIAVPVTPLARDGLDAASAERRLKEFFGVATLDAFGTFSRAEIAAAGAALAYVERTQLGARPPLSAPVRDSGSATMLIDAATRANLELTRTLGGERQGSLLAAIDRTVTPGGARLLAEWLAGPLTEQGAIAGRHDAVELLVADGALREDLRQALEKVPDVARALARLSLDRGGPRDLAALGAGLTAARDVAALLLRRGDLPDEVARAIRALGQTDPDLPLRLTEALAEELPLNRRDGRFVREGYDAALDELRLLQVDSRKVIAQLQARYATETGCRTLRIKHNAMLGYFVEVPQAVGEEFLKDPWRATFVHRQTMSDAMRFSSVELGELEAKIASAADRALKLELAIFARLTEAVLAQAEPIKAAALALAGLDVVAALADLAAREGWSRPIVDAGAAFSIERGRHPVVEAALKRDGKPFVANDTELSPPGTEATGGRICLITGPNMAGKSTFLRQNALIAILAQTGSFVPAASAHIGVVDRLFSRVGASDDLARGRSTFMVEMVETAAILNQAGERALVILDEIGRGTATFDGLSIAWAAVEYLHEKNRCRSIFATHFHEMTALSNKLGRLHNVTMRVKEWEGDVVFLHEVGKGAADRSYGVQVARLAGLPEAVVARAKQVLHQLEEGETSGKADRLVDDLPLFSVAVKREAPKSAKTDALGEALAAISPDEMTPREALEAIYRLKGLMDR